MVIATVPEWWDRFGDTTKKDKINEIIAAINTNTTGISTNATNINLRLKQDPDYDSGFFNVSANSTNYKSHGLGTANLLIWILGRDDSSNIHAKMMGGRFGIRAGPHPHDVYGAHVDSVTTTQIGVKINVEEYEWSYLRIQAWKLL